MENRAEYQALVEQVIKMLESAQAKSALAPAVRQANAAAANLKEFGDRFLRQQAEDLAKNIGGVCVRYVTRDEDETEERYLRQLQEVARIYLGLLDIYIIHKINS